MGWSDGGIGCWEKDTILLAKEQVLFLKIDAMVTDLFGFLFFSLFFFLLFYIVDKG